MTSVDDFVLLSKYAGERFDLVQAGGGNTSVKLDGREMWVKASGFLLSEVEPDAGYARVNVAAAAAALARYEQYSPAELLRHNEKVMAALGESTIGEGARPSIETFFHLLLKKYTLHSHPVAVCAIVSARDGEPTVQKLFPEAGWVPYATPGLALAVTVKKTVEDYRKAAGKDPSAIFLQNHGLIVSADTVEELRQTVEKILCAAEGHLGCDLSLYKMTNRVSDLINRGVGRRYVSRLCDDVVLKNFLRDHRDLFLTKCFCPDTLVFCGVRPVEIDSAEDLGPVGQYVAQYRDVPRVVVWGTQLFFIGKNIRMAQYAQEVFKAHLMAQAVRKHPMDSLSDEEIRYLSAWEAERYRQK